MESKHGNSRSFYNYASVDNPKFLGQVEIGDDREFAGIRITGCWWFRRENENDKFPAVQKRSGLCAKRYGPCVRAGTLVSRGP